MAQDIVFTKDFATKKAGEEWLKVDNFLARRLIHGDKVAVLKEDYKPEQKTKKTANKSK